MITYGLGTLLGTIFAFILYNYIDPTLIDDGIAFSKEIEAWAASSDRTSILSRVKASVKRLFSR